MLKSFRVNVVSSYFIFRVICMRRGVMEVVGNGGEIIMVFWSCSEVGNSGWI